LHKIYYRSAFSYDEKGEEAEEKEAVDCRHEKKNEEWKGSTERLTMPSSYHLPQKIVNSQFIYEEEKSSRLIKTLQKKFIFLTCGNYIDEGYLNQAIY
jgi:hypothetical protein